MPAFSVDSELLRYFQVMPMLFKSCCMVSIQFFRGLPGFLFVLLISQWTAKHWDKHKQKNKPNETKARFTLPFMPSEQEMDQAPRGPAVGHSTRTPQWQLYLVDVGSINTKKPLTNKSKVLVPEGRKRLEVVDTIWFLIHPDGTEIQLQNPAHQF